MTYGELTVIKRSDNRQSYWICLCSCGKSKEINGGSLRCGDTKSCGCKSAEFYRKSRSTHGDWNKHRLYTIWAAMKNRTSLTSKTHENDYSLRGIDLHPEWSEYLPFKTWALGNGYNDQLTIDRINNDKGYSPENCRWATRMEQANNRRTTKMIRFQNKETPRADFCRAYGLTYRRVQYLHYERRMSGEEILALEGVSF